MDHSRHSYTSTACQHDQHDACRKSCKFCDEKCNCACHRIDTAELKRFDRQTTAKDYIKRGV